MQSLEVSGAVRLIHGSLGVKGLIYRVSVFTVKLCLTSKKPKIIINLTYDSCFYNNTTESIEICHFFCDSIGWLKSR